MKSMFVSHQSLNIHSRFKEFYSKFYDQKCIHNKNEENTALKIMKIRYFSSLAVSEACALFVSPAIGFAAQHYSNNQYYGITGTIFGDLISATLSFSAAWFVFNRQRFSKSGNFLNNYFKETLLFISIDLCAAIPSYIVSGTASYLFIKGLNNSGIETSFSPIITESINYILIEGIYLFSVAKLSKNPLIIASINYEKYLEKDLA